jgi:hypothetical protein
MACKHCTSRFFWAGLALAAVIIAAFFLARHIRSNNPNDGIDKETNVARIELDATKYDKQKAVFQLKHYAFDRPEVKIVSGGWEGLHLFFHRIDTCGVWTKTTLEIRLPSSAEFSLKTEDTLYLEQDSFPFSLTEKYAEEVYNTTDSTLLFPYIKRTKMTKLEENNFHLDVLFFDVFNLQFDRFSLTEEKIHAEITIEAEMTELYQNVYGGDYAITGKINLVDYPFVRLIIGGKY